VMVAVVSAPVVTVGGRMPVLDDEAAALRLGVPPSGNGVPGRGCRYVGEIVERMQEMSPAAAHV
jgi:hypothetical protein